MADPMTPPPLPSPPNDATYGVAPPPPVPPKPKPKDDTATATAGKAKPEADRKYPCAE